MVVSPCYVPHFFCGTRQGRRTASSFGFPMTCGVGLTPRPLFYAYPGRISNNPHESMEPRCVLPSMRTISAPADCTRPLLGSGRNRYDDSVTRLSGASVILPEKKKVGAAIVSYNFCSDLYSLVVAGYLTISFSASARLLYPFWEAS